MLDHSFSYGTGLFCSFHAFSTSEFGAGALSPCTNHKSIGVSLTRHRGQFCELRLHRLNEIEQAVWTEHPPRKKEGIVVLTYCVPPSQAPIGPQ